MDSTTAQNAWNWSINNKIEQILEEIANHAEKNHSWSKVCYDSSTLKTCE